jgi:transcriptional regulator with XRE-family HTH domain
VADVCRRPLEPWEVRRLLAFGVRLEELRVSAGLSRAELGRLAELDPSMVGRLERAKRRPRPSTLGRLVAALVGRCPDLDERQVLDELLGLAGEAAAPESAFADRVRRRRVRRARSRANREAAARAWAAREQQAAAAEEGRAALSAWSRSLDVVVKALLAEERALLAEEARRAGRRGG